MTLLLALALPVLALFAMFAIDVANWFDYSRNLQNRADAAALAAGLRYGGTCEDAAPAQPSLDNIGQVAQNYAGAGLTSDLYYPYDAAGEQNVPNLKSGSLSRFHVLINSRDFWKPGQTSRTQSFTMGSPSTVCSSVDEDGNRGPFVDVKLTQDSLPLFLPLVGLKPTITAEARASLEQVTSETVVRPLAVRDDAAVPCVSVNFVNAGTNAVIKTISLSPDATGDPNYPSATLWDNPGGDSVQLPPTTSLANVYVQPFLSNCNGVGNAYDDSTHSGLSWINVYDTKTPSDDQAPLVTTGGVYLTGCSSSTAAFNPYFTSLDCTPAITANVAFAPDVPAASQRVTVTDSAGGPPQTMIPGPGSTWSYTFPSNYLTAGSGRHAFDITAIQTAGTIGGRQCGPGPGNPKPCSTDLGVQQQAFGACEGCGAPNESDGIQKVRVRLPTDGPTAPGQDVFPAGSSPTLEVEVVVQGLHFDAPGQPATVLRFGVMTDKATGLVDCGQGNGANADVDAITNGCPLSGSPLCQKADFCAPYTLYDDAAHPNGTCDPELRETADDTYSDCVFTTSGQRRSKIPGAVAARIVDSSGVCSPNHWPEYSSRPTTYSFPAGDPRAITMIITAPADLSKNSTVPIRNFATFYVTGWDTGGHIAKCTLTAPPASPPFPAPPAGGWGNEAFPGPGASNGAIWGHWIYYTDPSASASGTFCNRNAFGVCTPVLSR